MVTRLSCEAAILEHQPAIVIEMIEEELNNGWNQASERGKEGEQDSMGLGQSVGLNVIRVPRTIAKCGGIFGDRYPCTVSG